MLDRLPGFTPADERELEDRVDASTVAGAAAGYLLASLEAIPRRVLVALVPTAWGRVVVVVALKVVLAYAILWLVIEWPERR